MQDAAPSSYIPALSHANAAINATPRHENRREIAPAHRRDVRAFLRSLGYPAPIVAAMSASELLTACRCALADRLVFRDGAWPSTRDYMRRIAA